MAVVSIVLTVRASKEASDGTHVAFDIEALAAVESRNLTGPRTGELRFDGRGASSTPLRVDVYDTAVPERERVETAVPARSRLPSVLALPEAETEAEVDA